MNTWIRLVVASLLSAVVGMTAALAGKPSSPDSHATAHQPSRAVKERPDTVLVKFRAGVLPAQAQSVGKSHGAASTRAVKVSTKRKSVLDRWYQVRRGDGQSLADLKRHLRSHPTVEVVEPDIEYELKLTPNDPLFAGQWALHNTGQEWGLIADSDIDAPEAWDLTGNAQPVTVAIIDSGIDVTHPDLVQALWTNPGEIAGNGVDDDGNGYVDDVHGYDFFNFTGEPVDDHGHGTAMAGIIGARGNNGEGVAGVAWNSRIMMLKAFGPCGCGYTSDIVRALLYARDMGARIVNNSYAAAGYSQLMYDAIQELNEAGILFVAAVGQEFYYSDHDRYPTYPASYEVPNVLAVNNSNGQDGPTSTTMFGKYTIDMAAPGDKILSTVPAVGDICCSDPSRYLACAGGSAAAAHVSGAAAVLIGMDPTRTAANVKPILMSTLERRDEYSMSRLNLHSALTCGSQQLVFIANYPGHQFIAVRDEPVLVSGQVTRCGQPVSDAAVSVSVSSGDSPFVLYDDGSHGDGAAGDGVYANLWQPQATGAAKLTYAVSHAQLGTSTAAWEGDVVPDRVRYAVNHEPFAWIDATSGQSYKLQTYDQNGPIKVTVPIGFSFNYYGRTYDSVTITNGGALSFTPTFTPGGSMHGPLPNRLWQGDMIAVFWSYLAMADGGTVYALLDGVAPNRRFTVAWVDVPHVHYPYAGVTFEVTLHESDGRIVMQYLDTDFSPDMKYDVDFGGQATVGIQGLSGLAGTGFAHAQAMIMPNTALRFTPVVGPANSRPYAEAGRSRFDRTILEPVVFDGRNSYDLDKDALGFGWYFGDGSTGSGSTPSHQYSSKERFLVHLVVSDGQELSEVDTTSVEVVNLPPVADLGPNLTVKQAQPVVVDATRSHDPDGSIQSYSWVQTSGPWVSFQGTNLTLMFESPRLPRGVDRADLVFELRLTDDIGATTTGQITIKVVRRL